MAPSEISMKLVLSKEASSSFPNCFLQILCDEVCDDFNHRNSPFSGNLKAPGQWQWPLLFCKSLRILWPTTQIEVFLCLGFC